MNKNKKKLYILFSLIIGLGCYLLVGKFAIAMDERETTINHSEGLVAINPHDILQLISQDPVQAFKLIPDSDYLAYKESIPEIESVLWEQSDYIKITEIFFQVNWDDAVANWKVNDFLFSLSCNDANIDLRPQYSHFTFHQVLKHAEGRDTRIERRIYIEPSESLLEWSETEYSPDFSSHRYYDLSQVKISAEEALRIAENNGGSDYRATLDNECNISVFLKYSDSLFNNSYDWIVYYSQDFSVKVDKQTGVYKIISSK